MANVIDVGLLDRVVAQDPLLLFLSSLRLSIRSTDVYLLGSVHEKCCQGRWTALQLDGCTRSPRCPLRVLRETRSCDLEDQA